MNNPIFTNTWHKDCGGKIFQHFDEFQVNYTICNYCSVINPKSTIRQFKISVTVKNADDPGDSITYMTVPIFAEDYTAAASKFHNEFRKHFGFGEEEPSP